MRLYMSVNAREVIKENNNIRFSSKEISFIEVLQVAARDISNQKYSID